MGKRPAPPLAALPAPGEAQNQVARDVFLQRITARCNAAAVALLCGDKGVRSLHGVATEACRLFEDTVHEVEFAPPVSCKRGCSFCCYNQVSLTQVEALFLGMHLLEHLSEKRLKEMQVSLEEMVLRIKGMTRLEIGMIRHELPCVLLEHGACSAHTARPFACRGWNAVDVSHCRVSIEQRAPMLQIEQHGLMREIAEHIQLGMLQGSRDSGLEAGYLLLPRALHLMLDKGVMHCAQAWLHGGAFFAVG